MCSPSKGVSTACATLRSTRSTQSACGNPVQKTHALSLHRSFGCGWRDGRSKLKRNVYSSQRAGLVTGNGEGATSRSVELKNWRSSLSLHMLVLCEDCHPCEKHRQCSVTDAKSIFDCISKTPTRLSRPQSLELAIAVKALQDPKSMVRGRHARTIWRTASRSLIILNFEVELGPGRIPET